MRNFVLLFIISPALVDQKDVDGVITQIKVHITNQGAVITKLEKLGRRQLAYPINHFREGTYVLVQFQAQGREISELERRLRVTDTILRYLTVRLDADLKHIGRMKRKRASRKAAKVKAHGMGEPLVDEDFGDDEPSELTEE